jgi:hypothetical protein
MTPIDRINIFYIFEATPGIEIHENRHPQSCLASKSQSITRVQRPQSRLSLDSRLSVHGVVPNFGSVYFVQTTGLGSFMER